MNTHIKNASQETLDKVSAEYESTLNIPENKQVPQWILMPVGLIGSGKTTVVKQFAKHFGLIRISTDDVRERLKHRGYSYEGARDITQGLLKKYLNLGYSVAIDANTGSLAGIEYNKKTATSFPHVYQIFIHINPPEKFIINKLKNYKHTWLFNDGEHAVQHFHKNKNNFFLPNLPFVFEFDTSKDNLASQINEAVIIIKKHLMKCSSNSSTALS